MRETSNAEAVNELRCEQRYTLKLLRRSSGTRYAKADNMQVGPPDNEKRWGNAEASYRSLVADADSIEQL